MPRRSRNFSLGGWLACRPSTRGGPRSRFATGADDPPPRRARRNRAPRKRNCRRSGRTFATGFTRLNRASSRPPLRMKKFSETWTRTVSLCRTLPMSGAKRRTTGVSFASSFSLPRRSMHRCSIRTVLAPTDDAEMTSSPSWGPGLVPQDCPRHSAILDTEAG